MPAKNRSSRKSKSEEEKKDPAVTVAIITAVAGILTTIIVASGGFKQAALPIEATQTAEAAHTSVVQTAQAGWTSTAPATATFTATIPPTDTEVPTSTSTPTPTSSPLPTETSTPTEFPFSAPVIDSIPFPKTIVCDGRKYDVPINFHDADGDAHRISWELIYSKKETTLYTDAKEFFKDSEAQKNGTVYEDFIQWLIPGDEVTIRVTIEDREDLTASKEFSFVCSNE